MRAVGMAAVALLLLPVLAHANTTPAKQPHKTWEQRFAAANTTHDGHLTLEQAKAGYKTIAHHFSDIDTTGKGYVTENDVRAWRAQQKAAHHHPANSDPLRPRPAYARFPGVQGVAPDGNQPLSTPPATQVPAKATLDHAPADN